MKTSFKFLTLLIFSSLTGTSQAFPELPFCPAGGPPGWLNHFIHKRDQNNLRHYAQTNLPAYGQSGYYPPPYGYGYAPVYRGTYQQPGYYFSAPQNNRYRNNPSPYREY